MRIMMLAALAAVSAPLLNAPAQAMTIDQAREECRSQYGASGRAKAQDSSRTGVSNAERISACVKEKMKKK